MYRYRMTNILSPELENVANQPIQRGESGPKRLNLALLKELNIRSTESKQNRRGVMYRFEIKAASKMFDKCSRFGRWNRGECIERNQWDARKFLLFKEDEDNCLVLERRVVAHFCRFAGGPLKHVKRMTDDQIQILVERILFLTEMKVTYVHRTRLIT